MAASVGSVTHKAKFTLPSLSVSYRLQASRVLLPLTLISSQFHVTWREVGRPALSTHNCVRSFCPGSSFGPAVSLTQVSTRCGSPSGAAAARRRELVAGVRISAINSKVGRRIFLITFSFSKYVLFMFQIALENMNRRSISCIVKKRTAKKYWFSMNGSVGLFKKQSETTQLGFATGSSGTPWRFSATSDQIGAT